MPRRSLKRKPSFRKKSVFSRKKRMGARRPKDLVLKYTDKSARSTNYRPKFYEFYQGLTNIGAATNVFGPLFAPPQGLGYEGRQTQSATMRHMTLRFVIGVANVTGAEGCVYKAVVILDKQHNFQAGITMTGGVSSQAVFNNDIVKNQEIMFRNPTTADRYVILWQKIIRLAQWTQVATFSTAAGTPAIVTQCRIPLHNLRVDFDNTAGAITDVNIATNALYLCIIPDLKTGANEADITASCRTYFD